MLNRFALVSTVMIITALLAASMISAQDSISIRVGMDHPYAAFLESRAFGASKGATAEFSKMEWVTIDGANNKLYLAMSEITGTMADTEGSIQLNKNPCGIVYVADLDTNFNIGLMRPLVVGGPFSIKHGINNCDVNNISEPDGVAVDARGRVWIAEDSLQHENNMLWVYDPANHSLKRFASLPVGAEVTGTHVAKDGVLFFNVQHPLADAIYPYNTSVIGVVNGFNANTDDFEPLALVTGEAKLKVTVAAGTYQILAHLGAPIPKSSQDHIMGGIYDPSGKLMFVGGNPDGNIWLPIGASGAEGWLYTNHETQPGGVSKLHIRKDADAWVILGGEMVDFARVNGTWNNCGGISSLWNTGLSGEEYEPSAADLISVNAMTAYLGKQANPYDYGWIIEISPNTTTADSIVKHYAMGRKSNENAWVAPDNKTVYFGDDGSGVMLFKFVAATEKDLSSGTLYAGKVTQVGGPGADHRFNIEWIELGFGTNADIAKAIRELDVQLKVQ